VKQKTKWAAELGRLGGLSRSEAKKAAARLNAQKARTKKNAKASK